MSHNIQTVNDIGTTPTATVQTVNRPILIRFEHAGDAAPTATAVQVEVKVEVDGVWEKVGGTLVTGKEYDSSATAPKFTFDVAPLLASRIEDGDYQSVFSKGITSIGSSLNTSTETNKLMIKYKVEARALYVDASTGVLTLNETDTEVTSPSSGDRYAVNFYLPDSQLTTSKYANMTVKSGWNISDFYAVNFGSQHTRGHQFLTNCPTSLRRKIFTNAKMAVYGLANGYTDNDVDIYADYVNDSGVSITNHEMSTAFIKDIPGSYGDYDIRYKNITFNDSYLFSGLANATHNGCGANISIFPYTDGQYGKKLHFELMNPRSGNNPNLKRVKADDTLIYFLNDFGVWDFYLFDGFLDITHTHEKATFKRGFKDYTLRESSRTGIARGTTTETYTCHTLVNRETSEWLSEIFRSKKVYYYNDRSGAEVSGSSKFVPVIVVDMETYPSSSNKSALEPFSLSFVKDIHTIKG